MIYGYTKCSNNERKQVINRQIHELNAFAQVSGMFAESELGMIHECVKSGMSNAKTKGVIINNRVVFLRVVEHPDDTQALQGGRGGLVFCCLASSSTSFRTERQEEVTVLRGSLQ